MVTEQSRSMVTEHGRSMVTEHGRSMVTEQSRSMEGESIVKEYEEHLLACGKRTKGIRHSMRVYTRYLHENDLDLFRVGYREAQNFQSDLSGQKGRYQAASILGIIGSLSAFYDYGVKRGLSGVNPFRLIERVKAPRRIPGNIPDEKEMDALLTRMAHFTREGDLARYKSAYKAHVLAVLLYSTGMRISEAAALRVEDVDLERREVVAHDSKTRKERRAFLNEYACGVLSRYIGEFREKVLFMHNGADTSLLFGSRVNLKTWFNAVLAAVCREMGREKVTSHIFRHAFGYHMLRAGCDIRKIQKFLGHERLSTTGVYTKVDTEALRNILDHYHPRGLKREMKK